jgi:hypothetical protein
MANDIYDVARLRLLNAQLDWPTLDLVLSAWSGTPDFVVTDLTLADIKARGHTEIAVSATIGGVATSFNGTAQTDDVLLPLVPIGPNVTWFTMAERAVAHDSSELILFIVETLPPLPFVPNGLDLLLSPDWSLNRGWFRP